MTVDLHAELTVAAAHLHATHLRMLERLAVPRGPLCDMLSDGWSLGIAPAAKASEGLYQPSDGPPHLIIPVWEDGALIDLCAFRSGVPDWPLLRTGNGWALGLERGLEAHTWGPAALVATPLDWLCRGGRALCVLDWAAAEVSYLRDVPHLVCQSEKLASMLLGALTRPQRLPQISVEEAQRAAA